MQNCCFENASKLIHSYINFLISITADWRGKTNLSSASLYCANQDIFLLISGALNWKVTRFEVLFFSGRAILAWTWNYGRKKKKTIRKGHFQKTPWTHWLVKKCDGLILTGSISFCQWDNVFLLSQCHFNWAQRHSSETLISAESINLGGKDSWQ